MRIFEENSVLKDSQGAPYTFQWNPNNSGTHIKQNIVNVLDIIRYEFHEKKSNWVLNISLLQVDRTIGLQILRKKPNTKKCACAYHCQNIVL